MTQALSEHHNGNARLGQATQDTATAAVAGPECSRRLREIAHRYARDRIFILGPGEIGGQIDPQALRTTLVIGLDLAELASKVDVALVSSRRTLDELSRNGCQSELYLAPWDFNAAPGQVFVVPWMQFPTESPPLNLPQLVSSEFRLTDMLFISALQLARHVAELRGRAQTIYMIGFDFKPQDYSALSGSNSRLLETSHMPMRSSFEEQCFLDTLRVLSGSELSVQHVGFKTYSSLTSAELNVRLIGPELCDPCKIKVDVVAELTTNHFGDPLRLEQMIRSSHAAGADYIKLQKREVRSFYRKDQLKAPYASPFGSTFGEYREQLELNVEDFRLVDRLCDVLGIGWFVSVLDKASFDFMREFEPTMLKIPSTISGHTRYLDYVRESYDRCLVISTGMTNRAYEDFVIDSFSHCEKLYLLQCNSSYPTPPEFCNIAVINHYYNLSQTNPRIVPGYSSHDKGWLASVMAVAAGARMVEKHVKLGSTEWAHFDEVALDLTTTDFSDYVGHIRDAERMLGSPIKQPNSSEYHKYA